MKKAQSLKDVPTEITAIAREKAWISKSRLISCEECSKNGIWHGPSAHQITSVSDFHDAFDPEDAVCETWMDRNGWQTGGDSMVSFCKECAKVFRVKLGWGLQIVSR